MTRATERPWLVDVAIPVPLRQTFTYQIPPRLDPIVVETGHRVLVPFRAKLVHGITYSQGYQSDSPPRGLRSLVSYDRDQRVLSPEIEQLLNWLVRYYHAPIGEAVKMVLPPGILSERDILFKATTNGLSEAGQEGRAHLLRHLAGKPLTRKAWALRAQTKITLKDIRTFEEAGWLEIIAPGEERESIPHVTAALLTEQGLNVDLASLKRAPSQRALLETLRAKGGGPISITELNRSQANSGSLVGALEKRGLCAKLRLPKHQLERHPETWMPPQESFDLTDEQEEAFAALTDALGTTAFQSFLLCGVTGSGKTEVYLRAIRHCLAQGRQALFLVPEIALTPLMQRRICDRFGERLAILHSAVGRAQRSEAWARVLAGKVDVVLGARSGVFAPLPRLGLIIVDEEHDHSYKQHEGIRYQARDLALVRAKFANAVAVLGSATPSLESWHNHVRGRHQLLRMSKRATNAALPEVQIIDMRAEFKSQRKRVLFSDTLIKAIGETLQRQQQIMILLNRRGYHSFLLCRKCGETVMCDQCEVSLTFHATDKRLKCHYCDQGMPVPANCPQCESPGSMMQFFGEGTQQVQEGLARLFPEHVIDRLDRDRLTNREAHQTILARFERRESHILVGTQMIAKGHDFPNVTLVGIIQADQGLRIPDFRCAETVFQLLTQVAGRSGRGKDPGKVVVQTYMPEHYSITCAASHDFDAFRERELRYRRHLFYSPFAHLVNILITDEKEATAGNAAAWMANSLTRIPDKALIVLGPTKAPVGKIKGRFRFQLVLKSGNRSKLHGMANAVVEAAIGNKLIPRSGVIFDIDPYQFV